MSGIITILAVKGHPEFFRTGNIDKSLKSRRIQRRGFHDKVHGNCEKWNKFQLVGFENHSLFSNGSISIFIDDKSGSGNIRDKFLLVSGYGCGRNLKFLQLFIQINSAGTAFSRFARIISLRVRSRMQEIFLGFPFATYNPSENS